MEQTALDCIEEINVKMKKLDELLARMEFVLLEVRQEIIK